MSILHLQHICRSHTLLHHGLILKLGFLAGFFQALGEFEGRWAECTGRMIIIRIIIIIVTPCSFVLLRDDEYDGHNTACRHLSLTNYYYIMCLPLPVPVPRWLLQCVCVARLSFLVAPFLPFVTIYIFRSRWKIFLIERRLCCERSNRLRITQGNEFSISRSVIANRWFVGTVQNLKNFQKFFHCDFILCVKKIVNSFKQYLYKNLY